MKKYHFSAPSAVGSSSLLVIFGAVCLTMFSLLSLNTALAQRRLAEASLRPVKEYYAADLAAQTRLARLRSGELEAEGEEYAFSLPISENQTLFVELTLVEGRWEIRRWQAAAHPEINETLLPLLEGTKEEIP